MPHPVQCEMTAALQSPRHIVIGGGSGFIGTALRRALEKRGDRVTLISRSPGPGRITWKALAADGLPACDAVINFAGKHILDLRRRWDDAYRDEVIRSRVETTRILVDAINRSPTPPEVFVSTAGKCFYGTKEMAPGEVHPELDETSAPMGVDFPAELVAQWERAAEGNDTSKVRHVKLRIGVVIASMERKSLMARLWQIGRTRGFLPIIRLPFCLGAGAVIGKGTQMLPWIHIEDMVGILLHVLDDRRTKGHYNAVSPGIVTNREFIESFARRLRRPIVWSIPEWMFAAS
jgi:uncharacterized protein (TIGR01777 family)